jgi:hypothetical protein
MAHFLWGRQALKTHRLSVFFQHFIHGIPQIFTSVYQRLDDSLWLFWKLTTAWIQRHKMTNDFDKPFLESHFFNDLAVLSRK